jgi:hypothetical protein
VRSELIGSDAAALFAGYVPNTTPMMAEMTAAAKKSR